MTLIKKIKDKKVNFEFNKEYIKVVTDKISNNDAQFITSSFIRKPLPLNKLIYCLKVNEVDKTKAKIEVKRNTEYPS